MAELIKNTLNHSAIGYLLHHANLGCGTKEFYALKNEILVNLGVFDGIDIQYIEGKECFTCNGNGIYKGYFRDDPCDVCYKGWYKRPFWTVLQRWILGNYVFHLPVIKSYQNGGLQANIIGYIEKKPTEFSNDAVAILFTLKNNGLLTNEIRD